MPAKAAKTPTADSSIVVSILTHSFPNVLTCPYLDGYQQASTQIMIYASNIIALISRSG